MEKFKLINTTCGFCNSIVAVKVRTIDNPTKWDNLERILKTIKLMDISRGVCRCHKCIKNNENLTKEHIINTFKEK